MKEKCVLSSPQAPYQSISQSTLHNIQGQGLIVPTSTPGGHVHGSVAIFHNHLEDSHVPPTALTVPLITTLLLGTG
jgi:hypothetical protein